MRTTVVVASLGLVAAIVVLVALVVLVRGRAEARRALRTELELRARTLAAVMDVDRDGLELELPPRVAPEYHERGSGVYATIHHDSGRLVVRSPSLGEQSLDPRTAWRAGALDHDELEQGPDGIPCAAVTYSFVARADDDDAPDPGEPPWEVPPEAERRYQVRVAVDARPRDRAVAGLGRFLALVGAAAVAVAAAGALGLSRLIVRPLHRMTAEAADLTPEDRSRRLAPGEVVEELQALAARLNGALDRQADALDHQRRLAADASHELRTPVALLRGNAELLLRRPRSNAEYREGLDVQLRVASRMQKVIEDLLLLARADAGGQPIELEVSDLGALAGELCEEFRGAARARRIALSCEADGPVLLRCDRRVAAQLVQNLLSNALKFARDGGRVAVAVRTEGDEACLVVADDGPGVPAEHRERVFERFYRVREDAGRVEGAGLGLAIVAWAVRAHEGRVALRETPGGGATFEVRLPLRLEPAGRRPAPVAT